MGVKTRIRQYIQRKLNEKRIKQYEMIYDGFDKGNYQQYSLHDLPSESGFYWGELIKWSADIKPECILFVGENKKTAKILKEKMGAGKVLAAGLSDVDYKWDFEKDFPKIDEKVDLIVSQAILEHLLNPYKHLQDLTHLISSDGYILVHTVGRSRYAEKGFSLSF